jgi:hypothetical protein
MHTSLTKIEGRIAKCGCGKERPSTEENLPFFEYQGDGSYRAELICIQCGMHTDVHQEINPSTKRAGVTDHEFSRRGDVGHDVYYCGCRGWD